MIFDYNVNDSMTTAAAAARETPIVYFAFVQRHFEIANRFEMLDNWE